MQRRAAAAYVALFLVIAAGSYGVIATTDNPEPYVTEGEAEHTLTSGGTFEVDDRQYNVTDITAEEDEGSVEYSGTLNWTNSSAVRTDSWEANSTVSIDNSTYRVLIANVSNPTSVQLRPEPPDDVNPRFQNDTQVVDVDVDDDGFVEQGVPIGQYLSTVENRSNVTFRNSVTINGTERSVDSITNESVSFRWQEPMVEEVGLDQATTVELNGQEFFVYFESGDTAYLDDNASTNYYERQSDYDEMTLRINGFWAVTILSGLSAIGLVGMAYLPRRE